MYKLSITSY